MEPGTSGPTVPRHSSDQLPALVFTKEQGAISRPGSRSEDAPSLSPLETGIAIGSLPTGEASYASLQRRHVYAGQNYNTLTERAREIAGSSRLRAASEA